MKTTDLELTAFRYSLSCHILFKKRGNVIEKQKIKFKIGQYFIQNYLQSNHKLSKIFTKIISKSKM